MHGVQLEQIIARTLHEEHERRVQQYLLEREFMKARAAGKRTQRPSLGLIQRLVRALGWQPRSGSAAWPASQELTKA